MAGVSFFEGISPSSSSCRKTSSLHSSTMALSFTPSHQLGFSLMRLESAHIRSSTIWWGDNVKTKSSAGETCTHSPRVFLSSRRQYIVVRILERVFESTLWKLDRPPTPGLFAALAFFHRGGSVFGCQPHVLFPWARFFYRICGTNIVLPKQVICFYLHPWSRARLSASQGGYLLRYLCNGNDLTPQTCG